MNTYMIEVFRWLNVNSFGSNGITKDVKIKVQIQASLEDVQQLHFQLLRSLGEGEVLGLYRTSIPEEVTDVAWQSTNGN